MARIAIAWELGAGYGHVGMTRPVALELRRRGHEILYIVRETERAETVLSPGAFPLVPAPVWLRSAGRRPPPQGASPTDMPGSIPLPPPRALPIAARSC